MRLRIRAQSTNRFAQDLVLAEIPAELREASDGLQLGASEKHALAHRADPIGARIDHGDAAHDEGVELQRLQRAADAALSDAADE
jgi:hypothetical protein